MSASSSNLLNATAPGTPQRSRPATAQSEVPRRHFIRNTPDGGRLSIYPRYLQSNEYIFYDNDDLVRSKSRPIGNFVHHYDFRYWDVWPSESGEGSEVFLNNLNSITIGTQTDIPRLKSLLWKAAERLRALTIDESVIVCKGVTSLSRFERLRSLEIQVSARRFSDLSSGEVIGSRNASTAASVLSDLQLSDLLLGLAELDTLRLPRCGSLSDESLIFISNRFKHLKELDVSGNLRITNAGMHAIVEKCEKLEIINISGCSGITHFGLVNKVADLLQYFARPWKSMKASYCRLDAETLDWISSALHGMDVCDLTGVTGITDAIVNAIVINSPKLTYLGLSGCERVTKIGIDMIFKCCLSLTEVKVSALGQLDSSTINRLVSNNSSLTGLDISANLSIDDGIFSDLAKPNMIINIDISGTNVGSAGLRRIAECCPLLKSLKINGLRVIADSALSYLGEKCPFLETLLADDCTSLTDVGVSRLIRSCRGLKVLSLASSAAFVRKGVRFGQYTDQLVEAVLKHGRKVRELNLRNQCAIRLNTPWLLGRFRGVEFRERSPLSRTRSRSMLLKSSRRNSSFDRASDRGVLSPTSPGSISSDTLNVQSEIIDLRLLQSYKYTGGFGGNISLRSLDLRGLDYISAEGGVYVLSHCFGLERVRMPNRQSIPVEPDGEVKVPALSDLFLSHVIAEPKVWNYMFRKTCYTEPQSAGGIDDLLPHHNQDQVFTARYQDAYIRRRLLENWAVRLIQNAYRNYIDYRKRCKALQMQRLVRLIGEMYFNHKLRIAARALREKNTALRIQRYLKKKFFPFVHACVYIQRMVRGWRGRKYARSMELRHIKATAIQKLVRGWLYRKCEQYLLYRITKNLPALWQTMIQSTVESLDANTISPAELKKLQDEAVQLQSGISELFKLRGKKVLASVPKMVLQPFDNEPYASTAEGKKISYYYHSSEGILKSPPKKGQPSSLHPFNMTFWPSVRTGFELDRKDNNITVFNPHSDTFRIEKEIHAIFYCEICYKMLRMVRCKVCCRGMCFGCTLRTHTDAVTRKHPLESVDPSLVITKNAENKSLVYHMDMASTTVHRAQKLFASLQNAVDLKRIDQEKKLHQEMEREREHKKALAERAKLESQEKHDAVTVIAAKFRGNKARKYVAQKRAQKLLESALVGESQNVKAITTIQRFVRGSLTRIILLKCGFPRLWSFGSDAVNDTKRHRQGEIRRVLRASKGPDASAHIKVSAAQRCDVELFRRRYNDRCAIFEEMYRKHLSVQQFLTAVCQAWIVRDFKRHSNQSRCEKEANNYFPHVQEFQKKIAQRSAMLTNYQLKTDQDLMQLNLQLKNLNEKIKSNDMRLMNYKNQLEWVTMAVRNHLRRKSLVEKRMEDTMNRLEWIASEAVAVRRIIFELSQRTDALKKSPSLVRVAPWFTARVQYAQSLCASLDAQQESILKDEISRLNGDLRTCMELEGLTVELVNALESDGKLSSERGFLECKLNLAAKGSTESVEINEQLLKIKQKQIHLNSEVIDSVKKAMEEKYDKDDSIMLEVASFPDDSPDFDLEQMLDAIEAELIQPFKQRAHVTVQDMMDVVLVQPWNADEAVLDVRIEERIGDLSLQIDTINTESKHLGAIIDQTNDMVRTNRQKISELQNTVSLLKSRLEEGETECEGRNFVEELEQSETELSELEVKTTSAQFELEKKIALVEPKARKQTQLTEELLRFQQVLQERLRERDVTIAEYFKVEAALDIDIIDTIRADFIANDRKMAAKRVRSDFFKSCDSRRVAERIVSKELTLEEYNLLGLADCDRRFDVQKAMSVIKPTQNVSPLILAKMFLDLKASAALVDFNVAEEEKFMLQFEANYIKGLVNKKKEFESRMSVFMNNQLSLRRQRSLAKEIDLRRERLKTLREFHLAAIKSEFEKQRALKRLAAREKRKKEMEISEPTSIIKQVAKATKTTIRGAVDTYRKIKTAMETNMDDEEERMAAVMRTRKGAGNEVEALRKIRVTYTMDETNGFLKQNEILSRKGIPGFIRIPRPLSGDGGMFLWYERTRVVGDFITDIVLAHADPTHELYRDLSKSGYEAIKNDSCALVVWVARDPRKSKAIADINIALDSTEENRLMLDGFQRLDHSLSAFGLPDINVFVLKVNKHEEKKVMNANQVIAELKAVQLVLQENPTDPVATELYKRLHAQLEEVVDNAEESHVLNPLDYAIELMALDEGELKRWMNLFEKLDKQKTTRIPLDSIFKWLDTPQTAFTRHVFVSADALDRSQLIEFGDFMRSVAIYCFFGAQEIIKFLYLFADTTGTGRLSHTDFVKLLNVLHPYDKKRAKRALAELDLKSDGKLDFAEFLALHHRYPALFYPALQFQYVLRDKTMGEQWWLTKLRKYKGVRDKLKAMNVSAEEAAKVEMSRAALDVEREARMKEREIKMKSTTSTLSRAILQARQFMDEIS